MDARQCLWTGQRIRKLRTDRFLTQAALATEVVERAGRTVKLDQSTISKWESGDSTISLRYRRWLAEALEVPVHDLFEAPPDGWREDLREQVAA